MTTVFRMTYVCVLDLDEFMSEFSDYIEDTESGTIELWAEDVKRMEDELAEREALTEDECSPDSITSEQVEEFKTVIGADVYDMLLNNQLDVVLLSSM